MGAIQGLEETGGTRSTAECGNTVSIKRLFVALWPCGVVDPRFLSLVNTEIRAFLPSASQSLKKKFFLLFKKLLKIYFGCAGSLLGCPAFSSCGMWALWLEVRMLSCPEACGILVSWPGIKPTSPCIGRWVLNHWTTREVLPHRVLNRVLFVL